MDVEFGREHAHQVAEVDAIVRLEVEDRLVAAEEEFHGHRAHIDLLLGHDALEDGQRVFGLPAEIFP